MLSTPLISIITPTYNREKTLSQAVESVLSQTYKNWELIIIDDGSTDNTREMLSKYLNDPRIKYRYQNNSGQSTARNHALKLYTGKLVCFLDSDDFWPDNKLERQVNLMKVHPTVDIIHGDEITVDESGREITRHNMKRYSGQITKNLIADNSVSINTVIVKRHCFEKMGGLSSKYTIADDYELWLRFSVQFTFLYIPEYFGFYRVMKNQISTDKERRLDINEKIIIDFLKQNPKKLSKDEINWGLNRFFSRKARYYGATGRKALGCKYACKALMLLPLDSGSWRSLYRVFITRFTKAQ